MIWLRGLIIALVMMGSAAPQAFAQGSGEGSDARARELYQNGKKLYEEARYEDAIAAFEEAYRLSRRHLLLYNISESWDRAGNLKQAIEALNRYRAFAPADEREALEQRIRKLEERLAAQPAKAPEPQKAEAAPAPAPEPGLQPAEPAPQPNAGVGARDVVPWVVSGLGVAGLAAGIAFGLQARDAHDEAESACRNSGGSTFCTKSVDDAIDREERNALAADVSIGIGAAAVVTGVLLFFVWPEEEDPTSAGMQLAPTATAHGGGVVLGGRF